MKAAVLPIGAFLLTSKPRSIRWTLEPRVTVLQSIQGDAQLTDLHGQSFVSVVPRQVLRSP
jgi:hypothetical protein